MTINLLETILLLLPVFGPFLIFIAVLRIYQTISKRRKAKPPFTGDFLRSPGESLRLNLEEINEEMIICILSATLIPLAMYALYISLAYFYGMKNSFFHITMFSIIAGGIFIYYLVKCLRLLVRKKRIRLGYEGELEVSQHLNQLMLKGNHVYHDIYADKFNIDHVVVGPSGVYAVETKTRSKPITGNNQADATVVYDGKILKFPNWNDTKILGQARSQASWLSKELSSSVGEKVSVKPIIAIPGWFVKRDCPFDGIFVINPKNFYLVVKPDIDHNLDAEMIKRIAHQLEQKCRNVVPKSVSGGSE
jgi:hypothetical protein